MILQALSLLARNEGLIDDPDYEIKAVRWLVTLRPNGDFVAPIRSTDDPAGNAKRFRVPRQPKRASNVRPFFFCDNAQYVFGCITPDKRDAKPERVRRCFEAFHTVVARCASASQDAGAQAVDAFLSRLVENLGCFELPETLKSNDAISFVLDSDLSTLVTDRPAIEAHWRSIREQDDGDAQITCLVSGLRAAAAGVHPSVKKLPGRNPETALISFNKPAFWSYGWSEHQNATISRDSSEAFSTALNRLLDPKPSNPRSPDATLPRRNLHLSIDTVVCYWASDSSVDAFVNIFDSLLNANPESVGELYRSIWRGVPVSLHSPALFYALTISSARARAVVRDWLETSISTVADNLAAHFADLLLDRLTPPPKKGALPPQFPLKRLIEALCPDGSTDSPPPPLATQLFESAITGKAYGFNVLQRAVERTRAEITRDKWTDLCRLDARAALIKAFLNRGKRIHPETANYQEIMPVLDPTNASPGYLLGQLMAVLERAQQLAMDANATIVDRYFNGASAAPRSVFVRLLKNSQHHLRKADDDSSKAGTSFLLKRLIDQLADRFNPKDNGFPARLPIEQQGLFVLGYHQMRRWLWLNGAERLEWEAQCANIPAAYKWSKTVAA